MPVASILLRTRVVRWLRVLMPLAALALLSMLFLLARSPSPETSIPYVNGKPGEMGGAPGMTTPRYAGVTRDGARLTLSASQADPGGAGKAQDAALDWQARDGLSAQLSAPQVTRQDNDIALRGGVAMRLSSGWTLAAPQMDVSTDADQIHAAGGVQATAPFGPITADAMTLQRQPDGAHVLDLNGGVRLVYRP